MHKCLLLKCGTQNWGRVGFFFTIFELKEVRRYAQIVSLKEELEC